mgnify:CR=1 FL=1
MVVRRLPVPTGMQVKLQAKFRGPLVITRVLPNDTYQVSLLGNESYTTTAHCSQLKLFKIDNESGDEAVPGADEEMEVEPRATVPSTESFGSLREPIEAKLDTTEESVAVASDDRAQTARPSSRNAGPDQHNTDEELAELMSSFQGPDVEQCSELDTAFMETPAKDDANRGFDSTDGGGGEHSDHRLQAAVEPRYPKRIRKPPQR